MIRFVVPGVPVAKGRPRFVRATGRTYTPAKTMRFEQIVAAHAMDAMEGRPLIDGPVRVAVHAAMPIPQSWPKSKQARALAGHVPHVSRPDAENVAKAVLDAMNERVYRDDSQVVSLEVTKGYGAEPGTAVSVWLVSLPANSSAPLSNPQEVCDG